MPNHYYRLKNEVADDVRFALESFARRFATSLASLRAFPNSQDADNKLHGKDVALLDRCATLANGKEVVLVVAMPHNQSLTPLFEEGLEQSSKQDGHIHLAFVDMVTRSFAPHELNKMVDDLLRGGAGDTPKAVIVRTESSSGPDDYTALLKKHLGPSTALFRVTDDSCHFEPPKGDPIEMNAPALAGICAASFVHELYSGTVATVASMIPEEAGNLHEIHREQLLNF